MGIMKTLTINGAKYNVTPIVPASSVTLLASAWTGDEGAYSQVVGLTGVTANTKVDLQPTAEQLAEFHHKVLAFVAENEGGVVTVFAIGDKPADDYNIQTTLTEVESSGRIRGNTVGTTMPRTSFNQTDPSKADYLIGRENIVQSVNGVIPDEYGNVTVSVSGGNGGGGEGGFSPIATVRQTGDGAIISITDVNGTTTATVTNGKDGTSYEVSMVEQDYGYDMRVSSERGIVGYPIYHGKDGTTPHIGENGHWWIGDTDTGVPAESNSAGTSGTGLSQTEKTIILTLFRNIAYTSDMSNLVNELGALWGVVPDEPDVTAYTITNNLTNITTDNTATSINSGMLYTANLTAESGYTIDSVVVTMGDVEISAYSDGVVSIDSVTGDIVITATATQMNTNGPVYQLAQAAAFDGATASIDTGCAIYANGDSAWSICLELTDGYSGTKAYPLYFSHSEAVYIRMEKTWNTGPFYLRYNASGATAIGLVNAGANQKLVITHEANTKVITAFVVSDSAVKSTAVTGSAANVVSNSTVELGYNGFVGTIHDCAIYNRVLTETEINEYLGVA